MTYAQPSSVKGLQRTLGHSLRLESGAMALEFAFIVPVFLMLALGTVEVGRALFVDHTLTKAVRDGARYAIVRGAASPEPATAAQVAGHVRSRAWGLDSDRITIAITFGPDNNPGSQVMVQADYSHDLMFLFGPIGPITLSAIANMTIFQ